MTERKTGPVRGLFIGCGSAGGDWLMEFLKEPGVEVAGVVRPSKKFLAAHRLPEGVPVYPDYQTALAQAKADAVFISSPNDCHAPQFLACAERGLHVFLEKPVALTTADAVRMHAAAERAKITVFTPWGAERHFFLRESVEQFRAGRLGRLVQVHGATCGGNGFFSDVGEEAHYATRLPEISGGMMLHHTTHLIDWAMQIGSPVASVYCQTDTTFPNPKPRQEEAIAAILRFQGGGTATLLENTNWYRYLHWNVVGDRASRFVAWNPEVRGAEPYLIEDNVVRQAIDRRVLTFDEFYRIRDAERSPVGRFLDALRSGKPSASELGRAVDVMRVTDALHESARSGEVVRM